MSTRRGFLASLLALLGLGGVAKAKGRDQASQMSGRAMASLARHYGPGVLRIPPGTVKGRRVWCVAWANHTIDVNGFLA